MSVSLYILAVLIATAALWMSHGRRHYSVEWMMASGCLHAVALIVAAIAGRVSQ